jgi:hypothetical protein
MKLLTTRNGSYLTGNEIADAAIHYGLVLARYRDIDTIDIPFLDSFGDFHRVTLTVGWQADMTATTSTGLLDELLEPGTIVDLYTKAGVEASAHRAEPFTDQDRSRFARTSDDELMN